VEVANLRGGIGGWEFPPGATGGQFPENAIEDLALVNRRAAAPASRWGWRKKGLDQKPLFVGEVHYLLFIKRKTKEEQSRFLVASEDERGKRLSYSHYLVKISMRRRRLMEPSLIIAQIFYIASGGFLIKTP
jgi:hypothetical protein